MKRNMGTIDRALRIAIALAIGVFYYSGIISGTVALVASVVAVAFVVTGFISWCPLYMPLGLSTRRGD